MLLGLGSVRVRMRILIFLLGAWFFPCAVANGTAYYVSSSHGADQNSGLSPAHSWKSMARVNHAHLEPGDSVLFERGNLWRETLQPSSSGTRERVITYGSYGVGTRPAISGSDLLATSTLPIEDDRWQYLGPLNTAPASLWNAEERMMPVPGKEQVSTESAWWYETKNHRLYLKKNGPRNIEIQSRDVNIDNHEQSHIVYDNLDLRHARQGLRLFSWKGQVTDITLQNSIISTEPSLSKGTMSAGVYASVHSGTLTQITIQNNTFIPYPSGLEHWGIYFVQGVDDFRIVGNTFTPAGEDDITIWHSAHGLIAENSGGGNGENTIDVKDSHDVRISHNRADLDGEYNIVVHGVDSDRLTYNVIVENNHCTRGGIAGHLTAGIVLLFTRNSKVRHNIVEGAYGAGIFVNDREAGFHNEISSNFLKGNGTHQATGAITLEDAAETTVHDNTISAQGAGGFALRLEGGPHTRAVQITNNTFFGSPANMLYVAQTARNTFVADRNSYHAKQPRFRCASQEYSFAEWQHATRQDAHSVVADPALLQSSEISSDRQSN